jgi:segregation and condensation protein B
LAAELAAVASGRKDLALAEVAQLFAQIDQNQRPSLDDGLAEAMRIAEALLFAAAGPLDEKDIEKRMPRGVAAGPVLDALKADYASRGVNLVRAGGKWMFRTAADLAWLLATGEGEAKRLSRAAIETLAIVAYHQPVTRAEIEDIRGVAISKGTLDLLLETGWVRLRGRRRVPGRPITYGTTEAFLIHFGLEAIGDLPGLEELKGAGLFDGRLPQGFGIPQPSDGAELADDEEPLEDETAITPPTSESAAETFGGPADLEQAEEGTPAECGPWDHV